MSLSRVDNERALIRDAAERTKDPWLDYMYRFAEPAMTPAARRDASEAATSYPPGRQGDESPPNGC